MIEYVVQYTTRSSGRVMYESSNAIAFGKTTSKIERARRWTSRAEAAAFAWANEKQGVESRVVIV